MSEILLDRSREQIAIVTINRPARRNACDLAAWSDLMAAFAGLASDRNVRLAILTGAGGHFCAGDDLIAFSAVRNDAQAAAEYRTRIQDCYAAVQAAPFPVIAALRGVCVGGGCSLAMCCDFRISDPTVRVSVPVAKLGLVYPTIQLQRLAHLIGIQMTRRWLYTGDIVTVDEAHRAGFIDAVVDGDVVEAAVQFGNPMIGGAPLSIGGSKMQLNAISTGQVAARQTDLDAMATRADNSEDFQEAARAFAEKRKPRFVGR